MKLAVVVPRYGVEVIGGCEAATRALSEQLVRHTDTQVEVLTTTALDVTEWDNHYPEGERDLGGVRVRRFAVEPGRPRDLDRLSAAVMFRRRAEPERQRRWLRAAGPRTSGLAAAVRETDADVIAIHPYVFETSVAGFEAARRPVVFHPHAHDEPALRLSIFRPLFTGSAAVVFNSAAERRLCEHRFKVAAHRSLTLGWGVEPGAGDASAAARTAGVEGRPYLLCLGRVDAGKGTDLLAEVFAAYKERHPGPLALVFAGPVVHEPPPHPDIVVTGAVPEPVKWGLLRGCVLLVHPSDKESFSLALLEAWAAGVPALVNARCDVTREHCAASGGGLWFNRYADFEAIVDRLLADAGTRAALAANGARYIERNYQWPRLVQRYRALLDTVAARGVAAGTLTSRAPARPR